MRTTCRVSLTLGVLALGIALLAAAASPRGRTAAIPTAAIPTAAIPTTTAGTTTAAAIPATHGDTTIRIAGLQQPVEILVDRWGIAHIYAQTEPDLFFAQGWNAARDRLFQLELWRRQATGTVAEILGPRELQRDIGTRLFRFRHDLEAELRYYHPRGVEIVNAFVRGINAYIDQANRNPESLPIELRLLGIRPQHWTPAVVISRHQGLLGNLGDELATGRAVAAIGADRVKYFSDFGPGDPDLTLAPGIDSALLGQDILRLYTAFRTSLRFRPDDIAPQHRRAGDTSSPSAPGRPHSVEEPVSAWQVEPDLLDEDRARIDGPAGFGIGSNNWVVSGRLTQSGWPIMANDPHRAQAAPSLRYWVHLVGPGWNVIGGGEPSLPGISIGHNEHGAWGLTVFDTDGEDLLVYETNPERPDQYRYRGQWEDMRVIRDTIAVRGESSRVITLRYTRHGPVVHQDSVRNRAFAVRAAWMEIGGAPYLASLRMDQARTWEEFRDACRYSHIPGENMVWADRTGTIGWQAVGIAPVRRNYSGMVPVPGDGRYEWAGFLPMLDKPHAMNPVEGFLATANNDLIPRGYPHMDAVGFEWSAPYRWARIAEVLGSGRRHAMADMMRLQTDELSIPARQLVPLLAGVVVTGQAAQDARRRLLQWDYVLDRESVAAGIYVEWESRLRRALWERLVPARERSAVRSLSLSKTIAWLLAPPGELGPSPLAVRDSILGSALVAATGALTEKLGPRTSEWTYGGPRYKHALIRHPLSGAVNDALRRRLDVGPAPRGGYGNTVNSTGGGDNQTSGASFRIIVDLANWDHAVGTNTPGQSGDVDSPHYRDLFALWAENRFFPVLYSRDRVEAATGNRIVLQSVAPD